jgi:hypothetical protein
MKWKPMSSDDVPARNRLEGDASRLIASRLTRLHWSGASLIRTPLIQMLRTPSGRYFWRTNESFIWTILLGTKVFGLTKLHYTYHWNKLVAQSYFRGVASGLCLVSWQVAHSPYTDGTIIHYWSCTLDKFYAIVNPRVPSFVRLSAITYDLSNDDCLDRCEWSYLYYCH